MSNILDKDRPGSRSRHFDPFIGEYERESNVFTRSDGTTLLIRQRNDGTLFLQVRYPGSERVEYLSNLYRNGREFEDRTSDRRYRMTAKDGGKCTVSYMGPPTRKVGRKGRGRGIA